MMNIERLKLMSQMLGEVIEGTWQPSTLTPPTLRNFPVMNIAFELRSWFGVTTDGCGYSACAVGHACLDTRFNQQGFSFGYIGPEYIDPDSGYTPGWAGIEKFFGIDDGTAYSLFDDTAYLSEDPSKAEWTRDGSRPPVLPAQVKERIDQLIKANA